MERQVNLNTSMTKRKFRNILAGLKKISSTAWEYYTSGAANSLKVNSIMVV